MKACASAKPNKLAVLALASLGVVYGDIGTSPLYAFREALHHSGSTPDALDPVAVFGIASLMFWVLVVIVTIKYALVVLRADNQGEGGTLSLMTLAQRAIGHRTPVILALGMMGCALFFGDALITPAISVLSAVEGLALVAPGLGDHVIGLSVLILLGLFMVQRRGTGAVARFFGPIMLTWFVTLFGLGFYQIVQTPEVVKALNPLYAWHFITQFGWLALLALGGVFLVVTGAETMYADMGHFGRRPMKFAWFYVVFPSLMVNYLGQAALVLRNPLALENPFYMLAPDILLLPLVGLATVATVIASQAVISGAFSVARQAIQLGFLPRLSVRHTSEHHMGQIYIPVVNWFLMAGVILLIWEFKTSANLAAAYGLAVSATMVITALLCFVVFYRVFKWPLAVAVAVSGLFILLDLVFFAVNCLKLFEGGFLPVLIAGFMYLVMHTWVVANVYIAGKSRKLNMPWPDFHELLNENRPQMVKGTAIYLTSDISFAPKTLVLNVTHNKVIHERNIVLSVAIEPTPRVEAEHRVQMTTLPPPTFIGICMHYGYVEVPHVTRSLGYHLKRLELDVDLNEAIFVIGKRTYKASSRHGLSLWRDYIFLMMDRWNLPPTDHFHLPPARVLELGSQLVI